MNHGSYGAFNDIENVSIVFRPFAWFAALRWYEEDACCNKVALPEDLLKEPPAASRRFGINLLRCVDDTS